MGSNIMMTKVPSVQKYPNISIGQLRSRYMSTQMNNTATVISQKLIITLASNIIMNGNQAQQYIYYPSIHGTYQNHLGIKIKSIIYEKYNKNIVSNYAILELQSKLNIPRIKILSEWKPKIEYKKGIKNKQELILKTNIKKNVNSNIKANNQINLVNGHKQHEVYIIGYPIDKNIEIDIQGNSAYQFYSGGKACIEGNFIKHYLPASMGLQGAPLLVRHDEDIYMIGMHLSTHKDGNKAVYFTEEAKSIIQNVVGTS